MKIRRRGAGPSKVSTENQNLEESTAPAPKEVKEFYCSLCFETFTDEEDLERSLEGSPGGSRNGAYLQFVRDIRKHFELERSEFQVLSEGLALRKGGCSRTLPPVSPSLCNGCLAPVNVISKLFGELELLQMKLDRAISNVKRGILEEGKLSGRRYLLEKKLSGRGKLEVEMAVHQVIKRRGMRYPVPQVLLERMDTLPPNQSGGHSSTTSAIKRKPKPTPKTYFRKVKTPLLDNYIFGVSPSSMKTVGLEADKISSCDHCGKHFPGKYELTVHIKLYHPNVQAPVVVKTGSLTGNGGKLPPTPERRIIIIRSGSSFRTLDAGGGGNSNTLGVVNGCGGSAEDQDSVGSHPPSPAFSAAEDDHLEVEPSAPPSEELIPPSKIKKEKDTDNFSNTPPHSPIANTEIELEPVKIKEEVEVDASTAPPPAPPPPAPSKKVPFMSSEYIGKYKVVCKLLNVKTGKTCVGVIAKPSPAPAIKPSTSHTNNGRTVPKVISIQPDIIINPEETISLPPIPGPPYKCPVSSCKSEFKLRYRCEAHYQKHLQKLDENRKKTEARERAKAILEEKRNLKKRHRELNADKRRRRPQVSSSPFEKAQRRQRFLALHPHHCEIPGCFLKFQTKESLQFHHKMKHTPFQCNFCSETIPNFFELVSHEKASHSTQPEDASESLETCPRCSQQVSAVSKKGLKNHYAVAHYKIRLPRRVFQRPTCKICNISVTPLLKYLKHMEEVHGDEGRSILDRDLPNKCGQCEKRFRFPINLRQHYQLIHEGGVNTALHKHRTRVPVFNCKICGRVFKRNKWSYDNHMKLHETGKISDDWIKPRIPRHRPPKDKTGKKRRIFQARSPFSKVPWDEVPSAEGFVCDECGKSFPIYRSLRMHLRMMHQQKLEGATPPKPPSKVECPICGKLRPGQGLLRYHIRRVHPSEAPKYELKPEDGIVCHQCGRVYAESQSLNRHLRRFCQKGASQNTESEKDGAA